MEPIYIYISCDDEEGGEQHQNKQRRRIEKFTDADLDNLQRDLNECQQAISDPSGESTLFIHSILFPHNPNHLQIELLHSQTHPAPAPTQLPHFTRLLHDFEEFENQILPPTPHKDHFPGDATVSTASMDNDIQDSRVMIQEMAAADDPGCNLFFMGNSSDPPQILNTDFQPHDVWTSCDVALGSGIGAADYYGCAGGSGILQGGVYFQGDSTSSNNTFFGCSSVRYFTCSQNGSSNEFHKPNRIRCKKRRYKGVLETEEETARRLESTKIRNREAAAQAHLRKQSYDAHLQTLILKLRKKNEFLKKILMFLQGQKRKDVPFQPLRRSFSGPI